MLNYKSNKCGDFSFIAAVNTILKIYMLQRLPLFPIIKLTWIVQPLDAWYKEIIQEYIINQNSIKWAYVF